MSTSISNLTLEDTTTSPTRQRSNSIASASSSPNKSKSKNTSKITENNFLIDIEDHDYFGDDRIKPNDLRKLLHQRPDIANILYECLKEENISSELPDDMVTD